MDRPGERPGVSLLLSDGRNIGGFNANEADRYLLSLGDTGLDYGFQSVGQLTVEYGRGVFTEAFHNAHVLRIAHELATAPPPPR